MVNRQICRADLTPAVATSLIGGLVFLTIPGCVSPLAGIDRKTDALLRERSALIGSNLLDQRVSNRQPDESAEADIYDPAPATANPSPDQIAYKPAPQEITDAQIAGRLEAFADHAAGQSPDPDGEPARPPIKITINEAFRTAQETGREFLSNQEDYILAAIRLLQERHLWGPRFFNTTSATLSGQGDAGRFEHATQIINTLRATQRLPYGGSVEAQWVVRATDQLRQRATGGYVQSSELMLSADIPLLRGAGRVAREDLIQSERDLIYQARTFERSRRQLLVSVAQDYFSLIESASGINNQVEQIQGLERLLESTKAKVEAGRLRPFQQDLSQNQVLRAKASLAGQRERYILQLDRFKIRLGMDVETPLDLADIDIEIPLEAITQTDAVDRALDYRLDLQNQRDQLDDRRRAVKNARDELLPDLNITGSVGIPTPPGDPTGGLAISPDDLDYSLGLSLDLPLDRENERLALRSRIIGLEQARRDYDEFRDNLIVSARSSVRNMDLARFQLSLAEEQVRINMQRLEDLATRDDTDPQSVVDAESELNQARNSRDQSLTDLRNAVLNYLLTTGQLRVTEDGDFQPLPQLENAGS
ncbi:MAG: TolC family protein [Phycisphaeraceae bacterium]|nr:MAG: TolC family protein [Phycisphaeraceae bacterium]